MRFSLTDTGIQAAADQGVSVAEILFVMTVAGQRLIEAIDAHTQAVTGYTPDRRMIVVWLELVDDEYVVTAAFEAGLTQQAKWVHLFGRETPS